MRGNRQFSLRFQKHQDLLSRHSHKPGQTKSFELVVTVQEKSEFLEPSGDA